MYFKNVHEVLIIINIITTIIIIIIIIIMVGINKKCLDPFIFLQQNVLSTSDATHLFKNIIL